MKLRPARTYKSGLVRLPITRDCVGEQCPIAKNQGRCFTDWHHLYHPFGKFASSGLLVKTFHDDRHNLIPMARCRHNSVLSSAEHSKYDFALIPPVDVMVTFLDESAVLSDLGITVKNMARIVRTLTTEDAREKAKKPERSMHWLMYFQDSLQCLQQKMTQFEIVPVPVVENAIHSQQANIAIVNAAGFSGLHDVNIELLQSA
ncbi:hypothetical protein EB118_10995 [bacterium]|nr:hypothetical protein [bacterium]NBX97969.1 hypothetical protein [bacterium]NDC94419.1 hypothetical protein [bacterium]NDD83549.1 hypothetical protein [bacterium]NDG30582.1 hypothetical protein [bacterium]